jgi:outer membrane protein
MRTTFALLIVLAGFGLVGSPATAEAQKIGYLNSQAIIAETPGAIEAQQLIQQERQRLDSRLQALNDSAAAMRDEYSRQSVLLSPEEKTRREDQLRQRLNALGQRAQILQEEAINRQQELMAPVMSRVEQVIEAVRNEGGYGIIFDTESGAMVAADTTLDLTSQIIARLKAPADGGRPLPSSNR